MHSRLRWDRYPGRTAQTAVPKSSKGARTPEQERQGAPRGQRWPPTRGHRRVTRRGFRHRPRGFALGRALCRAMGPAARGSFVVGCPPNVAAKGPKRAAENRGCLQRGARQPKTSSRRLSRRGNPCARIGPLRCPQKANTLFSLRSSCDLDVLGLSVLRAPRTARNAPEITPRRPDGPKRAPRRDHAGPRGAQSSPRRPEGAPRGPPDVL